MRKSAVAIALLVFSALVSGGTATADPSGPLTPVKRPICDNGFGPWSTPTVLPPEIKGYGWSECDLPREGNPGLTHHYYMSLQRRTAAGGWDNLGEHVRTSLVPWSRQTHTASAPCQPGYWRIFSSVRGPIQGREYGPIETVSQSRVVTAAECGKG